VKKIERLTDEQEQRLVEFRDEWLGVGLATGPCDMGVVERVVGEFYRRLGHEKPRFWRVESPLQAQLVMNIVSGHGANLLANLRTSLRANLWGNLRSNLVVNLAANLWGNLGANLWDNLRSNLGSNLRDNLVDNLGGESKYVSTYFWGSLDAYWIAYYLFPHLHLRSVHTREQMRLLGLWADLSRSCFWWWAFENVVFVSDRPSEIHRDGEGRLHNLHGPSVSFSDGYRVYRVHGVEMSGHLIEDHSLITPEVIDETDNVEVRRVLIDILGVEKYMSDAQRLGEDERGVLWRKAVQGDEPLVVVEVVNSTPEPDGTCKHYFLRVPPHVRTPTEAVKWTFGVDDYQPQKET